MKVSILGQAQYTHSVASIICQTNIVAEVALVDEKRGIPRDTVEDLREATALAGGDTILTVSADAGVLSESQVVILLAPHARPVVRSVQAHRTANVVPVRRFTQLIKAYAPTARILIAASPANFLANFVHHELEAENGQVIGLSSGMATAYLKTQIADQLTVSVSDVTALVIGNDDTIYPLPQYCRVNGIPIDQLMSDEQLGELTSGANERHRRLTSAEASYSQSVWVSQIITAIALDKKRIMSVGALVRSSNSAVYLSVPSKIGANGVEAIIQLELTETQREQFTDLVAKSMAIQK
jgi:malate dehydrogenase